MDLRPLDSDQVHPIEYLSNFENVDRTKVKLTELFRLYGASSKSEEYIELYSTIEGLLHDKKVNCIVEFGTASGSSARALSDKYPSSTIYTIDINESCQLIFQNHPKIVPITADQSNIKSLTEIANIIPSIDLVIDDGSHMSSDILKTLQIFSLKLKSDSIYVIEDCDSAGNLGYSDYMNHKFRRNKEENLRAEYLKMINDLMITCDTNKNIQLLYTCKCLTILMGAYRLHQ